MAHGRLKAYVANDAFAIQIDCHAGSQIGRRYSSRNRNPHLTIDMEEGGRWLEARVGSTGFRADITTRQHRLSADEPEAVGGTDAGPTPYEYLLAALASCTAMTIRLYANRKSWPLESATVFVRHTRSHEKDCEMCETQKVGIGAIEERIELEGALTDEQKKRLLEIAGRCPIRQSLARGIEVTS